MEQNIPGVSQIAKDLGLSDPLSEKRHQLDNLIIVPFKTDDIRLSLNNLNDVQTFFAKNSKYKARITQYLMSMVENISSISYRMYSEEIIDDKQVKNYASKCIMQNIKNLCDKISEKIANQKQVQEHGDPNQMVNFLKELAKIDMQKRIQNLRQNGGINDFNEFLQDYSRSEIKDYLLQLRDRIEQIKNRSQGRMTDFQRSIGRLRIQINQFILQLLEVVILQISSKYPLAPPTAVSSDVKKIFKKINLSMDYDHDFLKLNMKDQVFQTFDQKVMKVGIMKMIKKLRKIPFEILNNQTYFDLFQRFNKNILWLSTRKQLRKDSLTSKIETLYNFLCKEPSNQYLLSNLFRQSNIQDLKKIKQKELSQFKQQKRYQIGVKLNKSIPDLKEQDIKRGNLVIKHSSILRILVKWIEELKDTFQQSQENILKNQYTFKTKDQKELHLNIFQRRQLNKVLKQKWISKLDQFFKDKQKQVRQIIAILLTQGKPQNPQYTFQKSLVLSSKLNSYLTRQSIKVLVRLLTELSQIPKQCAQKYKEKQTKKIYDLIKKLQNSQNTSGDFIEFEKKKLQGKMELQTQGLKNLDLISNRLGDLMRAKFFLNEDQVSNILYLLYQLNQYCLAHKQANKHPFFELIQIKDKLEKENNNIHINYMFYSIQCQLQICINTPGSLKQKNKLKKTYQMRHFHYELTRGLFGSIGELVNIINKSDPLSLQNSTSNFELKKRIKDSSFNVIPAQINNRLMEKHIWQCCNINCNQFDVDGRWKLVKITPPQNQSQRLCMTCFKQFEKARKYTDLDYMKIIIQDYVRKNVNNKFIKCIKRFLNQNPGALQPMTQEIFLRDSYQRKFYLRFQLTQSKIHVYYCLVFYSYVNSALIMQQLNNENKDPKIFTLKQYKQEKESHNIYYLEVINERGALQFYRRIANRGFYNPFSKRRHFDRIQKKAVAKINIKQVEAQITNNNTKLILNQKLGVQKLLLSKISERYYQHVKICQAKDIQLKQNIFQEIICKMNSIQFLNLSHNKIVGSLLITFEHLEELYLNNNLIEEIKISQIQNLKIIEVERNNLKNLVFIKLPSLQTLSLERNKLDSSLYLNGLPNLKYLNVSYNKILKLYVKDSLKLQYLNCKRYSFQRDNRITAYDIEGTDIIINKQVKLKVVIFLNNAISTSFFNQINLSQITKLHALITRKNLLILEKDFVKLEQLVLYFQKCQGAFQQLNLQGFINRHSEKLKDLSLYSYDCLIKNLNIKDIEKVAYRYDNLLNIEQNSKLNLENIQLLLLFGHPIFKRTIELNCLHKEILCNLYLGDIILEQFQPIDYRSLKKIEIINAKINKLIFSNLERAKQMKIQIQQAEIGEFIYKIQRQQRQLNLNQAQFPHIQFAEDKFYNYTHYSNSSNLFSHDRNRLQYPFQTLSQKIIEEFIIQIISQQQQIKLILPQKVTKLKIELHKPIKLIIVKNQRVLSLQYINISYHYQQEQRGRNIQLHPDEQLRNIIVIQEDEEAPVQ